MIKNCTSILDELEQEDGKRFSRAYVTLTIQRSLKKVYKRVSQTCPELTPYERIVELSKLFNLKTDDEFRIFFKSFPIDIRTKIKKSAMEVYNG